MKINDNRIYNNCNESDYKMNYYSEQTGMNNAQYNGYNARDLFDNLWSNKHGGVGVIACEIRSNLYSKDAIWIL